MDDSFRKDASGWSVAYRDGFGNGLDLNVTGGRFEARPFFLGSESISVGPAASKEAFLKYISLAGDQWSRVLKQYLEERYPVTVAEVLDNQPTACYLPDGWLRTLLIPVPVNRLGDVLHFHQALAEDPLLGASQFGSIALQPQVVNYVEGRAPKGCGDAEGLVTRHLLSCNTPLAGLPVREVGTDGSAAWTLRRCAYLYRCSCFIRDVPHTMDKLAAAGLLSIEPDLWSAVAPAELMLAADHATWWSAKRECRSTWAGFNDEQTPIDTLDTIASEVCEAVVVQARAAGIAQEAYFGLTGN